MKKFLIISTSLILASVILFVVSLGHFIKVNNVEETKAPTVAPTVTPTLGEIDAPTGAKMPESWQDNGIFSQYYDKAYAQVMSMSSEELAGQLIIGYCPTNSEADTAASYYNLSGYLYTSSNFYNMTMDQIKSTISTHKQSTKIPMIAAVVEEGGAKNTLSDLDAFYEYEFASPRTTFANGGIDELKRVEGEKAHMLASVGINLNLGTVCDMATESNHIMYSRSLGGTVDETSEYVEEVVKVSQNKGVSATLKHFPGYGTLPDPNVHVVVDERSASEFESTDYKPFESGAKAGVHCIMMSSVLVRNLDAKCISSLSPYMHTVLRDDLDYTGLIITDNLDAADFSEYSGGKNVYVQAIIAGNDQIIVSNIDTAYNAILSAINDGTLDLETVQKACTRVLAYKRAAGILK